MSRGDPPRRRRRTKQVGNRPLYPCLSIIISTALAALRWRVSARFASPIQRRYSFWCDEGRAANTFSAASFSDSASANSSGIPACSLLILSPPDDRRTAARSKGSYTELVVALCSSVTRNWQTLLEFARTLPPEGEVPTATATTDGRVPTAATSVATDDGDTAATTTIATPPPQRLRQHHTRLTPAQKDEVIALYQRGVPVGEICQRYGISRQQVSDLRNARNIPRRPRGLSDKQKRQAEQHYLAGQSCATIGRHFGVHAETVRRYLRTTGVALRPRPGGA